MFFSKKIPSLVSENKVPESLVRSLLISSSSFGCSGGIFVIGGNRSSSSLNRSLVSDQSIGNNSRSGDVGLLELLLIISDGLLLRNVRVGQWLLDNFLDNRLLNVLDWLFNVLDSLNWLLDVLDRLNWLLNVLNWLLNVLNLLNLLLNNWLVYDLLFYGLVFYSFDSLFLGNVLNVSFLVNLGDVLGLVFNGIVVSHFLFSGNVLNSNNLVVFNNSSFSGNLFDSLNCFVLDFGSFVGNVLYSGLSLNYGLGNCLLNNLDWLLNYLNWLLNLLNDLGGCLGNVLDWLLNGGGGLLPGLVGWLPWLVRSIRISERRCGELNGSGGLLDVLGCGFLVV